MNSLFQLSSWGIRRLSAISHSAVCVSQKYSLDHSVSAPHLKMLWVDGDINLSDQEEGALLHMLLEGIFLCLEYLTDMEFSFIIAINSRVTSMSVIPVETTEH